MFIYDAQKQKWLINGVLQTGNPYIGKSNGFQLVRKDWFYDEIFAGDTHSVFYEPHQNGKYFLTTIIMAQEKSMPNINTILYLID
ncbi:adhesion and penetration protein [Neisseria gonorrhoeae]|uniref:Adhesion and penetration protein n=1 Tax=Neisseria gonorrhoeae TaxID=485 RepID=A0A378W250_NEIGO|nr:adhesion and penetration protein [Neisseria gonorrhoeae]